MAPYRHLAERYGGTRVCVCVCGGGGGTQCNFLLPNYSLRYVITFHEPLSVTVRKNLTTCERNTNIKIVEYSINKHQK